MDLRAAFCGLLRNRSVTVLALACLALGVGTSGALLGALLYRPPPRGAACSGWPCAKG